MSHTKGWKRVRPGVYIKSITFLQYRIMRYYPETGGKFARWLLYGAPLRHVPAYFDLRSAQLAAHQYAENNAKETPL